MLDEVLNSINYALLLNANGNSWWTRLMRDAIHVRRIRVTKRSALLKICMLCTLYTCRENETEKCIRNWTALWRIAFSASRTHFHLYLYTYICVFVCIGICVYVDDRNACIHMTITPGAHNLPIGTPHYSCLQLLPGNQPATRYLPRSNSVAARSGFELTINFKRSMYMSIALYVQCHVLKFPPF